MKMKTVLVFNDVDTSCVAAIEYVIRKYGKEEWFNAALAKVVTDIYTKKRGEIVRTPFVIVKEECVKSKEIFLTHKGYHYIVHQMERYYNKYNPKISENDIFYFAIYILFLIIFTVIFSRVVLKIKKENKMAITH